ncbi:MAG: PAS domain S-box protein, partial [Cyanobacteria bacterium]|nr:PAS domain S-box protein [Cyanobacteriota bacterium]
GTSTYQIIVFKDRDIFLSATPLESPRPASGNMKAQEEVQKNSLDRSKQKIRQLFDKLPLALFVVSKAGLIEGGNAVACEILGYTPKQLASILINDLFQPVSSELELIDFLSRMIGRTCRVTGTRASGAKFPAEIQAQFFDDAGELLVLSVFDISKQEELERFRSELQRTLRHDIRAPLTSIRLFLDTLKKGFYRTKTAERLEERATLMFDEAAKLVALTNDLMHMNRLDTDPASYNWTETSISDLIHGCLQHDRSFAEKITVCNSAPPDSQILTDAERLKGALCDLLKITIELSESLVTLSIYQGAKYLTMVLSAKNMRLGQFDEPTENDAFFNFSMARAVIESCGGELGQSEQPDEQGEDKLVIAFPIH